MSHLVYLPDALTLGIGKPLGRKAYGHISHLPGSQAGVGDHFCEQGQYAMLCLKQRDERDEIIVQEKLDGSCVAVARIESQIVPLIRAGHLATKSPYKQHHKFAEWVGQNVDMFSFLNDGERVCGEWLLKAHGTRYLLKHEPFVAFDLMRWHPSKKIDGRVPFDEFVSRTSHFPQPRLIHRGLPFPVDAALQAIETSGHGAIDPVEGAVWRIYHNGKFDFIAKYVRRGKLIGAYMNEEIYNANA